MERIAHRVVYENRWMRVREDDVRLVNGEQSIYGVVEKPDYVLVVPWHDDRLGVVTQYRYPIDAWRTEFPQGGTDGSGTVLDAAVRELREETGIIAGGDAARHASRGLRLRLAALPRVRGRRRGNDRGDARGVRG